MRASVAGTGCRREEAEGDEAISRLARDSVSSRGVGDAAISRLAAVALPATGLLRHDECVPRNDTGAPTSGTMRLTMAAQRFNGTVCKYLF
jgi:hypothetical protein